jgi:predicted RecB family nuclease
VQVAGTDQRKPVHELLPAEAGRGLTRLPEPSAGDVFFDLEGDPFVALGGREYLFGFTASDGKKLSYYVQWALNAADEKQAFESFVDQMMLRWEADPKMHIYHFVSYEPSALKRLMGRHATREEEIDRMLRAGLLVDLHAIYRQSIRASVEEYSLKAAEVFHNFRRSTPLEESRRAMRFVEHTLELSRVLNIPEEVRITVAGYNWDDCQSTKSLRDWLEKKRAEQEAAGNKIARPSISEGAAPEKVAAVFGGAPSKNPKLQTRCKPWTYPRSLQASFGATSRLLTGICLRPQTGNHYSSEMYFGYFMALKAWGSMPFAVSD